MKDSNSVSQHTTNAPIFVLGAFHSGTTILYRMLAMHPDVSWLSQFSQRSGRIPHRTRLPFYPYIDRMSRRLFAFNWRQESRNLIKELMVARPMESQSTWRYAIPPGSQIEPEESVRRVRQVLTEETRFWDEKRILVKYPYLSQHIHILRHAYPEAQYVHVVRDGRAVTLSLQRKTVAQHQATSLTTDFPRAHYEVLGQTARDWVDVIEAIQAERESIDLVELRYEDFCNDVHANIRMVLKHLCLPENCFPFARCPERLKPTNAKRIESAPPEVLTLIEQIQRPMLALYGYS